MNYIIYAAIAALVVWSVRHLISTVRRQLRGDCGGACDGCGAGCGKR